MRILVISDVHGKKERFQELESELKSCDAVAFAGDFTEFDKPETFTPCFEALCKAHDSVFAVLGNCDEPEYVSELEKEDISVQGNLVYHEGLLFAGSGGGSKFTGTTPNERTEEDLQTDFNVIKDSEEETGTEGTDNQWNNLILIMHNPPKGLVCDQCAPDVHVGSGISTDFIAETKPLAVITGHIHEGVGIDKIGDTVVINPGPLAEGKYGILEIEKNAGLWSVKKAELKSL